MSIHGYDVHTRVQECPISTKYGQQLNPAVNHEESRSSGQGYSEYQCCGSVCGGSHHIFSQVQLFSLLFLHGAFSYFLTSNPPLNTLEGIYEIYLMAPEGIWKPRPDAYANRKERIMYWEGKITEKRDRIQVMLEVVELDQ